MSTENSPDPAGHAVGSPITGGPTNRMPTVGEAISLATRDHVDSLYEVNLAPGSALQPGIPDLNETPARDQNDWYLAAIEQALCTNGLPFDPKFILEMDMALSTYLNAGVDWRRIHSYATSLDSTVPLLGTNPYWTPQGEPLSVLAFLGGSTRFRIATDSEAKRPAVELLATDPDPQISQSAKMNLGWTETSSTGTTTTTIIPFTPAPPRRQMTRGIAATLTGVSTAVAISGLFAILVASGLNNAYDVTVVDQKARGATDHEEFSGTFGIEQTGEQICGGGEDYLSCANQHVTLYNTVCRDVTLDAAGQTTCEDLSAFIDEAEVRYAACGSGCITDLGDSATWGWSYLTLVPQMKTVSNDDSLPKISHKEYCYFSLGPVHVGECSGKSS